MRSRFLRKKHRGDLAVLSLNLFQRQSGPPGDLLVPGVLIFPGKSRALEYRIEVGARGVGFGFLNHLLDILFGMGAQAVRTGRGRIGGQHENRRQNATAPDGLKSQYRGHQRNAVEGNALPVHQITAQGRGPGGPVAFARQKLGRRPALIARQVQADKLGHAAYILLDAPERLVVRSALLVFSFGAPGLGCSPSPPDL